MKLFVRAAALLVSVFSVAGVSAAPPDPGVIRVAPNRAVPAGEQTAIFAIYATREGGTALWREARTVDVNERGEFEATFGALTALAAGTERWLGVRVLPQEEGRRTRISTAAGPRRITVHVDAAHISAVGIIETMQGFRFPDGTVQTTAVTGAAVNSHGSTHAPAGADPIPVGTPVTIGTTNAAGSANSLSRSDHVHAHGAQTDGTLHAAATTGAAGFLSAADKTKLNSLPQYARTVFVSPVGTEVANGTALLNALATITTNSATNPFLLKIEPGVYDIGNNTLTMKTFVDIEGSGQNATFIKAQRGSGSIGFASTAAIAGATRTELRNLTLTNTGGTGHVVGYFVTGATFSSVRDVTITVSGAASGNTVAGIYQNNTGGNSLTVTNATITATGTTNTTATGIHVPLQGVLVLRDSTVTATGGTNFNKALHVGGSSARVMVDSSALSATGTVGTLYGIQVTFGTVNVYNSVIKAFNAGIGVITDGNSVPHTSIVDLERCSIFSLGGTGARLALSEGQNSTIRAAASLVDEFVAGTPACVFTYSDDFVAHAGGCPLPPG